MAYADLLSVILDDAFSEIYVIDCETLRLVEVNRAARRNLQHADAVLAAMRLPELALAQQDAAANYRALLDSLDNDDTAEARLDTTHVRADGSTYPVELRLRRCGGNDAPALYVAIGRDVSERQEATRALNQSESRFRAIVSNTPGLVYQFMMQGDAGIAFPYLSEGCHALLGISAEALQSDAARFLALILPADRASYTASMTASAADKRGWNWVGRIWIEEWKDIKWINLRATPRDLPDGSVQWEGIMTNVTQSKLEEAEIKQSRAQLAELSAHVETVKEQERTRIAREIHDDLGGNLTAIKMSLALLARRLPADAQLVDKASYLDSLVDRTIESVHRISGDLRPSILDFGLVAAIDWQAKEFEKQLGITCEFAANRKDIALHPDQATALFRIFQEALTNISKHANATRVQVGLVRSSRSVRMHIIDNGRGIENADRIKSKSFGIRGMIERASGLGGDLSVMPGERGGSIVSVVVPLAPLRKAVPAIANGADSTTEGDEAGVLASRRQAAS